QARQNNIRCNRRRVRSYLAARERSSVEFSRLTPFRSRSDSVRSAECLTALLEVPQGTIDEAANLPLHLFGVSTLLGQCHPAKLDCLSDRMINLRGPEQSGHILLWIAFTSRACINDHHRISPREVVAKCLDAHIIASRLGVVKPQPLEASGVL